MRYIPGKIHKKGWINKRKENNRAVMKITQEGIDLFEEIKGTPIVGNEPLAASKRIGSQSQPTPDPDVSVAHDRRKVLRFLFYEDAFSVDSALVLTYIANKMNRDQRATDAVLLAMVRARLALKSTAGGYYLTREGRHAAEAVVLGGEEFTTDTMEAFLLNPLGRKIIHVIEEGLTVNQIAEKVGYNVEATLYDETHHLEQQMEYSIEKTYHILDRMHRHGLIELRFHSQIQKSTIVVEIPNEKRETLEILRTIAILIEYIPSLLLENKTQYSILRRLLSPHFRNVIEKQLSLHFSEVNSAPDELRRKVAYAERCAYWLNVEKLEEDATQWRDATIVVNGGRHYYMVRRRQVDGD